MKIIFFGRTKSWIVTVSLLMLLCSAGSAAAQEEDTWEFDVTLYGWYAGIDGSTRIPVSSGVSVSLDASDIVENLEMVFMGGLQAKYNRWSILADVIYLDIGDDTNWTVTVGPEPGVPANASLGLDLSSWLLSGGIGYDVMQTDRVVLAVLGGARYLDLEIDARVSLKTPLTSPLSAERSRSEDLVDGIVGVRGYIKLNEKWYLPYYADIGTGDSDLTWQLFGGIGYRFGWGDIKLGYRYLKYELEDDRLLADLELSGPILGVGFRF